jgi:hypothetical protein
VTWRTINGHDVWVWPTYNARGIVADLDEKAEICWSTGKGWAAIDFLRRAKNVAAHGHEADPVTGT